MNLLQNYLLKNSVDDVKSVINLGGRLKEFDITIKAISGDKNNQFQTLCIDNPNSPKKRKFNAKKYNELIVTEGMVEPSLKDPEWIKSAGVADSTALLYKSFLAGEIAKLAEEILKLSGFDQDIEEEVEEVKNS